MFTHVSVTLARYYFKHIYSPDLEESLKNIDRRPKNISFTLDFGHNSTENGLHCFCVFIEP